MTANIVSIKDPNGRGISADVADDALLKACADDNEYAQNLLFRRYHSAVYTFLKRLSGTDESDLDDMVQHTFIEIFKSARKFEYRSQVKSWVFAIATNVAKRYVRTSFRRNRAHFALSEIPRVDESPDAHDYMEKKALLHALEIAVGTLPYRHRVVFLMCDVENIPGVEVARILKIKEGTLWSRLHDARKKLAQQLAVKGVR